MLPSHILRPCRPVCITGIDGGSSFSMALCLSTPSTAFAKHSLKCSVPWHVSGELFPAWSLCCYGNSHSTAAGCVHLLVLLQSYRQGDKCILSLIAAFPFRVSNTVLLSQWRSPGDNFRFEVFLCKNPSCNQGPGELGRGSLCFYSREFPGGPFSIACSQAMSIYR